MSPPNLVAAVVFLAVWVGYTFYADSAARKRSLMGAASRHRAAWIAAMLARENRIVDVTVVATLSRSVLFFAQSGMNPSDVSTTMRTRASLLGVSNPRVSVTHLTRLP